MSLSPVQARVIANTGLFDEALRAAARELLRVTPLLWRIRLDLQRDRSRVVTRRKQRSKW